MSLEKITQVALALGATIKQGADTDRYFILAIESLEFCAYFDYGKETIRFNGAWPQINSLGNVYTFRHEKSDGAISVSSKRAASAIAKDVKNRFLKTYEPQFFEMLAKSYKHLAEDQRERSEFLELSTIFSDMEAFEGHQKNTLYVRGTPDIRLEQKYSGFEFTISGLGFEDARQLAHVLRVVKLGKYQKEFYERMHQRT